MLREDLDTYDAQTAQAGIHDGCFANRLGLGAWRRVGHRSTDVRPVSRQRSGAGGKGRLRR